MMAEGAGGPPAAGAPAPAPPDILDTQQAGPTAIRGAVLRVAGYGVGTALALVSISLLTRHLGISDFGRYATVISLVTIVAGLTEAGITSLAVREYSALRTHEARVAAISNLLGIRLVLTLAGLGIAVGFGVVAGYEEVLVAGIALAGLGLVTEVLQAAYTVPLQARLRLGWLTALEVARQVATVAITVGLIVGGAGLLAFFAVPVPAGLIALALTVPLVRGMVVAAPSFHLARWWPLIRATLPYAAATAAGILYAYLIIVVMSLVASPEQTGLFGVSFRVWAVIAAVPVMAAQAAFPILVRAARDDDDRLAYAVGRLFEVAVGGGALFALATAVGAPVVVEVVGGAEFADAVGALRILAVGLALTFVLAVWGFALLSLRRYWALLACNGTAVVVSAALALALTPGLGAEGGALAAVGAQALLVVAYGIALVRARGALAPGRRVVPRALAAAGLSLCVLLVPGMPVLADLALVVAVYVTVLVGLGGLPVELRQALLARRG